MNKTKIRSLKLRRESIRSLTRAALIAAAGGDGDLIAGPSAKIVNPCTSDESRLVNGGCNA